MTVRQVFYRLVSEGVIAQTEAESDASAADPDRLARFTREAQILASLNHPNIAAIHGIEEAEGTRALVLELVEGPTGGADLTGTDPAG